MNDRKDTEFFPTPEPLAEYLVNRLAWQLPAELQGESGETLQALEPSAGMGPFVRALAQRPSIHVTGIDPNFDAPKDLPENAEWERMSLEDLHEALEGEAPFDIACGNPPFSLAHAHLLLLFKMVRKGGCIGFLLRSGFLSSAKRASFFAAYPPKHVYIFSNRPSFAWSWICKEQYKKKNIDLGPSALEEYDHVGGCGHKWFTEPGTSAKKCPECGNTKLQSAKTDQYDYMFAVWAVGMDPDRQTTLSWLNEFNGEET